MLKVFDKLPKLFTVVSIITFTAFRQNTYITHEKTVIGIEEDVGDNTYSMGIGTDGTFNCYEMPKEMQMELLEIVNFGDLEETERNIQEYFKKLREEQKSE